MQENVLVVSIVDDDESSRRAIASLVRSLGAIARTFASAEEFLQSAHLDDTGCLISDVQMPGMSGVELQTRLAADGRHIPVIFITAFPNESIRKRALRGGAACFLHKPFDAQALIKCLDDALSKPEVGQRDP